MGAPIRDEALISCDRLKSFSDELLSAICGQLYTWKIPVGERHAEALRVVSEEIARSVVGKEMIRSAICLDTGLGKTTTIVMTLLTCQKLDINYPMLLSVPNIRSMAEILVELESLGYEMSQVGNVRSADAGNKEDCEKIGGSTPPSEWHLKPVLLICQQRMRTRNDWSSMLNCAWGKRAVFYDESLNYGETASFEVKSLQKKVDDLREYFDSTQAAWLDDCIALILGKIGTGGGVIEMPEPPANMADAVQWAAKKFRREYRGYGRFNTDELQALLMAGQIRAESYGGFRINYLLPDDIDTLFVFDANHKHSLISRMDETIKVLEWADIKRYDNVMLHCYDGNLGSEGFFDNLESEVAWLERMHHQLDDYVLFHFKDKSAVTGKNPKQLTEYLDGIGVRKRISWGNEAGFNGYRDVPNIVCAGVLRLSDVQTAGKMALVKNDLAAPIPEPRINSGNEQMLRLYQAMSRGVMRKLELDKFGRTQAKACNIFLNGTPTSKQFSFLRTIMPGVKTREMRLEDEYVLLLKALEGRTEVSSKELKGRPELTHLKSDRHAKKGERRWEALLNQLEANTEWRKLGRGLVRVS